MAMRIVVTEFMSLDGVVQAPGGPDEDTDGGFAHGGWSHPYFDVDVMGSVIMTGMANVDALLFGRRTFEAMAGAWPDRAGDPYADQMNAVKKYVVSNTLDQADVLWNNSTVIPGAGAIQAIRELRSQEGRDLVIWGSASLARAVITADLVDELLVMIEPVTLGGGKRIFPEDGAARPWRLISAVTAGTGVLVCQYQPA